jgi:RNA polymerase subunit RPABC4/transcription elongation factor Spt4
MRLLIKHVIANNNCTDLVYSNQHTLYYFASGKKTSNWTGVIVTAQTQGVAQSTITIMPPLLQIKWANFVIFLLYTLHARGELKIKWVHAGQYLSHYRVLCQLPYWQRHVTNLLCFHHSLFIR